MRPRTLFAGMIAVVAIATAHDAGLIYELSLNQSLVPVAPRPTQFSDVLRVFETAPLRTLKPAGVNIVKSP
jgi:hypothetical protein